MLLKKTAFEVHWRKDQEIIDISVFRDKHNEWIPLDLVDENMNFVAFCFGRMWGIIETYAFKENIFAI